MSFEPTASERAVRKDEHLDLAVRLHGQERPNAFDDVSFMHHALPGTATGLADTGTTVCGVRWEVPFYINAMTGGTQATAQVNAGLARAAAEAGVAIACGSQHIALREPERADGFQVIRREAPDAFVLANVGPTVTGEQALRAVEMLQADALQVHLNVAQELIMPLRRSGSGCRAARSRLSRRLVSTPSTWPGPAAPTSSPSRTSGAPTATTPT